MGVHARTHAPPVAPTQPLTTPSTKSLCIDPADRLKAITTLSVSRLLLLLEMLLFIVILNHTLSPYVGFTCKKFIS